MTVVLAGAVLLLVLLSALLSASEMAAFSVSASRMRTLREEGFEGAEELDRIRSRSGPVQAAVHLITVILNLSAVGLAVLLGAVAGGTGTALVGLVAGVATVLLVSEIGARAVAARRSIRMALRVAPFLGQAERWVRILLSPILRLELLLSRSRNGEEELSEEERTILEMSELGQEEGIVDMEEHLLVERAFRLDELTAWDVMTPRVDVFAWHDDTPLATIIPRLQEVPYSRVPVYGGSIDDVTGILYVREAYESWVEGKREATLAQVCREPFFVPGSMSLAQLLRDFQARRIHMGVVADDYGGTDGIVTLEDVLEELVGEIVDETDVDDEPLMRISRDEMVADGNVDLREINYAFNVSLPQLEHRSLNGYILEEMGYVPEKGEAIERNGVQIDVLEVSDTQVLRARLRRLEAPADDREAN